MPRTHRPKTTSRTTLADLSMSPEFSGAGFVSPEGLRALLLRLHNAGRGAWRHDAEAAELMRFTMTRYGALARKHGLEPEDAAWAAYEAMLNESTRRAANPWAVVTTAVRTTMRAEERANGLLTSTDRARRADIRKFHDVERFSDRENDLAEYHPALRINDILRPDEQSASQVMAARATDGAVMLLVVLGWPAELSQTSVDYVCARLAEAGDRRTAYEALRKDKVARIRLDLSHHAWIGLLRFLLGYPTSVTMTARLGVLVRLVVGDALDDLLDDSALVHAVAPDTAVSGRRLAGGERG